MHRLILAMSAVLVATPVFAADWVVARVSGKAWLTAPGAPPVAVTRGMVVPSGSTLSTDPGARVKLDRNAETILVSPGTVVTPKESWFGTTTIVQPAGRTELEVEKRNVKHFSVETPYLAAVVKGTRFTVDVSRRAASVQVSRGLVEVKDNRSGESVDIAPGQRASAASGGAGLQVSGAAPAAATDQPAATSGRAAEASPGRGTAGRAPDKDGSPASGGARPSEDRTSGEKGGNGKGSASEGKGSDDKGSGGKGSEGRGSEGRGSDGKGSDDRSSDSRGASEGRGKDDKGSDGRSKGGRG